MRAPANLDEIGLSRSVETYNSYACVWVLVRRGLCMSARRDPLAARHLEQSTRKADAQRYTTVSYAHNSQFEQLRQRQYPDLHRTRGMCSPSWYAAIFGLNDILGVR